jgi:DNA polymerase III delta prime subunit
VDTRQQQTVTNWVVEGSCPHVLFAGKPGTGKCLVGTELVDVIIDDTHLSPDQIRLLDKYRV